MQPSIESGYTLCDRPAAWHVSGNSSARGIPTAALQWKRDHDRAKVLRLAWYGRQVSRQVYGP
jgi:hypothetical protein